MSMLLHLNSNAQTDIDTNRLLYNDFEIGLLAGANIGQVSIKRSNGLKYNKAVGDQVEPNYFIKLNLIKNASVHFIYGFSFASQRSVFLGYSGYNEISTKFNLGYKIHANQLEATFSLGYGLSFLTKVTTGKQTYQFSKKRNRIYNESRISTPVGFDMLLNFPINQNISIDLNAGLNYNLIPYYLGGVISSYPQGWIGDYVKIQSVYACAGVSFKIFNPNAVRKSAKIKRSRFSQ